MRLVQLSAVVSRTQRWLSNTQPKDEAAKALRQLGLWLCDQTRSRAKHLVNIQEKSLELPTPDTFLNSNRPELLKIAEHISLSSVGAWCASDSERQSWAQFMGAVSLSYAKTGDVVVVAALVRAAARLDLQGAWLDDAQHYLIDQQQPDGSFGLLAAELAFLGEDESTADVVMRLTVEMLWAIAEVITQRRRAIKLTCK